jgi:hypothetical protein
MPMKKHKPEQIVSLLRQIEVEMANGKTTPQACKEAEITVQTFYRWRKEYGGLKLDQAKRLKELERERERQIKEAGREAVSREADPEGCGLGKLLSPERRRCAVKHAREKYEVSERHACRLLGQWRRTQRYAAMHRIDEAALTEAIVALASEYGRYGYRRITALLQRDGWHVGKDRVQRIWRREGLEALADVMLLRMLTLIDEFTRESLAILRPERANSPASSPSPTASSPPSTSRPFPRPTERASLRPLLQQQPYVLVLLRRNEHHPIYAATHSSAFRASSLLA